jgi:hypothetical protein
MKKGKYIQYQRVPDGLRIELIDSDNVPDVQDIIDDLMRDDIHLMDSANEWTYLGDQNNNVIYFVNGYGYDKFSDLIAGQDVVLPLSPETYKEYVESLTE